MKRISKVMLCALLGATMVLGGCGSKEAAESQAGAAESAASESTTSESAASESTAQEASGETNSQDIFVEENLAEVQVVDEEATLDNIEDFVTLGDFDKLKLTRDESAAEGYPELIKDVVGYEVAFDEAFYGSTVTMDYDGTVDGEAKDGMSADDADLVLGSGQFIDGFEDQLVGAKPGETVTVNVTFPEDYQSTELAGKDAVFVCQVHSVWRDFWDCVVEMSSVKKIPQSLYDQMEETINASLTSQAEQYSMSLEEYLEAAGYTDQLDETIKAEAKWALVNMAVLHKLGVDHDSEDYQNMLTTILAQSEYNSIDEAVEAGLTEQQITITTEYYTAIYAALKEMGKI